MRSSHEIRGWSGGPCMTSRSGRDGGHLTAACESWNYNMLFRVIHPPDSPRPVHAFCSCTCRLFATSLLRHAIRLCKAFHKSCRSPAIRKAPPRTRDRPAACPPAFQDLQRRPAMRTGRRGSENKVHQRGRVSLCTN